MRQGQPCASAARALSRRRLAPLILTLATPLGLAAQEVEPPDETQRWVPSFSILLDFVGQKAEGTIRSGLVQPPPDPLFPDSNPKIRPDASGSDTMTAALVGGSLELMTPRLSKAFARPRLFVHGDLAYPFAFERTLAGEGSPGMFAYPDFPRPVREVTDQLIEGQGSRTKAELKPVVLSAGAGIAFSYDLLYRRIRIKPSFEYVREEIEVSGIVQRAVSLTPATVADGLEDFRLISLMSSETRFFHGIGPGLEIEADTMRAGPFLLSVYASGRGYRFLGDLDVQLSQTNEFGETAVWTFEKLGWGWRAGVGLRFRWLPE
jgi:hypothetical protein